MMHRRLKTAGLSTQYHQLRVKIQRVFNPPCNIARANKRILKGRRNEERPIRLELQLGVIR